MAKATRPIFIPSVTQLVDEKHLEFEWFMGMARIQKQKNIESFHNKAREVGYSKVLEVSTYSPEPLGVKLSAFNLRYLSAHSSGTVEELYQKSKILRKADSINALGKKNSKGLQPVSFKFEGFEWPLEPRSGFYDWLYLNALQQNLNFSSKIFEFQAFTDIAYNPKKSLSTQARSVALYVSLVKSKKIDEIKDPEKFIELLNNHKYMSSPQTLFSQKKLII